MNYPEEIWADTDLVCSDEPHEGWQKYRRVNEPKTAKGMKLSRVEMMDGKPVRCFIEDKPANKKVSDAPESAAPNRK